MLGVDFIGATCLVASFTVFVSSFSSSILRSRSVILEKVGPINERSTKPNSRTRTTILLLFITVLCTLIAVERNNNHLINLNNTQRPSEWKLLLMSCCLSLPWWCGGISICGCVALRPTSLSLVTSSSSVVFLYFIYNNN